MEIFYKKNFFISLTVIIGFLFSLNFFYHEASQNLFTANLKAVRIIKNVKKENIADSMKKKYKIGNIIAFVFYGRRSSASILFRYLDKNLKINGGLLDKIVIVARTGDEQDLDYLKMFLRNNKYAKCCYERRNFDPNDGYKIVYSILNSTDLVFKIDDDVVFISNGTFEKMAEEYLTKNYHILSANVVNHPQLSYVHARLRAILPFYEVQPFQWEKSDTPNEEIDDTVAMGADYGPVSKWWRDPQLGAIAHESFLFHVKNENLDIYDFRIWDFHSVEYHRWSLNFVVVWGRNLNRIHKYKPKVESDEIVLTHLIPKMKKKHSIALGSAVVCHFSYFPQFEYLSKTNILEKYNNLSFSYLKI